MHNDPNEQDDLGTSAKSEHDAVRNELKDNLFYWLRNEELMKNYCYC